MAASDECILAAARTLDPAFPADGFDSAALDRIAAAGRTGHISQEAREWIDAAAARIAAADQRRGHGEATASAT